MDNVVEPPNRGEYDALTARVARVEGSVGDLKDILSELKVMVARIDAQIPYLATKAEIADLRTELRGEIASVRLEISAVRSGMPSKTYMWGILSALLTAYACGLAALAVLK